MAPKVATGIRVARRPPDAKLRTLRLGARRAARLEGRPVAPRKIASSSVETEGAAEAPSLAAERLADAKSEFEYAQHLPLYPDRARALADKAQADAETALQLAQAQARTRDAAREVARHALVVGAVTP